MNRYIIGNWKMNGATASVETLALPIARHVADRRSAHTVVLCPPAPLVGVLHTAMQPVGIAVGAQDCSQHREGAFTGETSAILLKELGVSYVILGHSERRHYQGESSELVAKKTAMALECGLIPVVCVGETQAERDAGRAPAVIQEQVACSVPQGADAQILVAYEPVWAIGTGRTATVGDIEQMHGLLRYLLPHTPLLYGGSVNPANAAEILATADVNGVLVGGASLKAETFCAIIDAA